ncbi:GTPase-activating protein [Apophysomyces sp. BC1034]|nr:GTPase-activating protein [Apophysomyces sp. BC1021]KAG0191646.1 GTPase-activating protein [Apophysomyces sp. BC1034]
MAGAMSMLKLPQLISAVSGATSAAYKIYSLIDRNPEIDWTSDIGIVPQKFTGDVKFQHISFHYPSRPQQPVLKNVDLEVHPGMTVALVGSSGSGKSTAVQLLQRFYDPTSGQILVGGHDLKTLNLSWVRQQIGIVSQEPVLFNMSIRENIILGTTHLVSSEELVDVCKKAHCHNFISQLPNGYDTLVGPQGGTLSGGQKQRIAIARAIIKNPAILLLDEATSALDTQSERLVQLALDSAAAGRTTLVVAHRLSTIRNANLIIVLDKGEIVEQGTHRTLVECNGIYAGMVKKQEIITSSDMSSSNESNTDEDTQVEQAPDTFDKVGSLAISEKDLSLKRQSTTDSANNHETAARKRLAGINEKEIESLPYRKIIQHMRPEWPLLVVGSLGSIISGSVLPMLALNLSTLVTLLVTPGSRPEDGPTSGANLHALLFVFLGIYALIGHTVQIICFDAAGERFAQRLRRLVFKAYMKQEVGYFDQPEHSSGSLTAALMVDTKNVKDLASKGWGDLIQIAVTVTMGKSRNNLTQEH